MTGSLFPQTDDDLNETNLSRAFSVLYESGYVESGCTFNLNGQANTLDIDGGEVLLKNTSDARFAYPDPDTLTLPVTSGTNYIYITADPTDTTETAVSFVASDTDTPPSAPMTLKIGEADTSGDTVDDTINRDPPSAQSGGIPSSDSYQFEDGTGVDIGAIGYYPIDNAFEIRSNGSPLISLPGDGSRPEIQGSQIVTEGDNPLYDSGRTFGPTAPSNPGQNHVWYYYPPQS